MSHIFLTILTSRSIIFGIFPSELNITAVNILLFSKHSTPHAFITLIKNITSIEISVQIGVSICLVTYVLTKLAYKSY